MDKEKDVKEERSSIETNDNKNQDCITEEHVLTDKVDINKKGDWKPWLDNLTFFTVLYVLTIAILTGLTSWRNFMGFGQEVKVTMSLQSIDFQTILYIVGAYIIILLLVKLNILPNIVSSIAGVLGILVSLGYLIYGLVIAYQVYKEEMLLEQSTVIGIVITIGFGVIGLRTAGKSFKLKPSKS